MSTPQHAASDHIARPHWGSGALLAFGTVLVLLAFMHHPAEIGTTPATLLASIAGGRAQAHLVHGAMFAAFTGYALAFTDYAVLLGLPRRLVRSGLTAYLLGTAVMLAGIVIDGFVAPDLAAHLVAGGPDLQASAHGLMLFADVMVQDFIKFGFGLLATAAAMGGVALLRSGAAHRIEATIGLAAGVLALALLLIDPPRLAPMLIPLLLILQTIWNLAASVVLWRSQAVTLPDRAADRAKPEPRLSAMG